jgi:MSHA type pilus biogenesis protein MshL
MRVLLYFLILIVLSCAPKKVEKVEVLPTPEFKEVPPPPPDVETLTPERVVEGDVGRVFSLEARDITLEKILSILADEAGLNIIFDEGVEKNLRTTVSFSNYTLEEALDAILLPFDYIYSIEKNTVRIKAFDTRIFELGFIPNRILTEIKVGGDVLGGGETETEIAGQVGIRGSTEENTVDFWKQIDESIRGLISPQGSYAINRFTGTILVKDRRKNLEAIEKFIEKLKSSLGRQVLIEAKVVEVSLRDERSLGIDWSAVSTQVLGGREFEFSAVQGLGVDQPIFEFTASTDVGEAIISALGEQGKVDVISNPRLSVINGQTALISVGKIQAYWELEAQVAGGVQYGEAVVYPERKSVLVGLLMGVTPFISETGEVILHIIPIVTDVTDWETYVWEGQTLIAPDVDIRQASTVIRVKEGETVIIGGLLTTKKVLTERKIPFLGDIPLLGYLFKREEWKERRAELVLFLTPVSVKTQ